jgi:hypothetical protein
MCSIGFNELKYLLFNSLPSAPIAIQWFSVEVPEKLDYKFKKWLSGWQRLDFID